jgi:glycosyltransferase involved in cell wall biosynthesis
MFTDGGVLGGAEEALLMLIEALDRDAWQPSLFAADSPVAPILVSRAEALGATARIVRPLPLGLDGARGVPRLIRLLRRTAPDVFHAHLNSALSAKYALAAGVIARVPAVLATVQLMPPTEIDRSNQAQLRLLAKGVDRYLAVSRAVRDELIRRVGVPAGKVEVVYNAVHNEALVPADGRALRGQLARGKQLPIALTVARLDPQKGHRVLLEAACELPDLLLVFAGEGPERAALTARAAALGIADRVLFLGHREDVRELLAACDVFVLPSFYEGSSLAVLEAMAAGKAVVATAIGGTDELISDGETGLLTAPGDADALANAIRQLVVDVQLRDRLGVRARERVRESFTQDVLGRRVAAAYEVALGRQVSHPVMPPP